MAVQPGSLPTPPPRPSLSSKKERYLHRTTDGQSATPLTIYRRSEDGKSKGSPAKPPAGAWPQGSRTRRPRPPGSERRYASLLPSRPSPTALLSSDEGLYRAVLVIGAPITGLSFPIPISFPTGVSGSLAVLQHFCLCRTSTVSVAYRTLPFWLQYIHSRSLKSLTCSL